MTRPYAYDLASVVIDARRDVQKLLLEQHKFVTDKVNAELLGGATHDSLCRSLTLLVGAAFSLWRAAFLADDERERLIVLSHIQKFLRYLIRDNTIGFSQDRDTQTWTSIYYISSANMSLIEIHRARPTLTGATTAEQDEFLNTVRDDISHITSWSHYNRKETIDHWQRAFARTNQSFLSFKREFEDEYRKTASVTPS